MHKLSMKLIALLPLCIYLYLFSIKLITFVRLQLYKYKTQITTQSVPLYSLISQSLCFPIAQEDEDNNKQLLCQANPTQLETFARHQKLSTLRTNLQYTSPRIPFIQVPITASSSTSIRLSWTRNVTSKQHLQMTQTKNENKTNTSFWNLNAEDV